MMSGFSSIYPETDQEVRRILARVECPSASRVEELLARSRGETLTLPELAELLEIGAVPSAVAQFDLLRAFAGTEFRSSEGNRVRYVAPIYVSSYCIDACPYCNFSAARKETARRRLSLEELDREVEAVMERDARAIELVYATDPEFTVDLLVRYTARVAEALWGEPGSGVLLCTEYLSSEAYEALAEAGLWGIVQWDETLDRGAYERWHSTSPHKREFVTRMDNHDRALAAGLEVATGALFGLADFRYDALLQVAKARHFERTYGRGPFVFGVPRLKPIAGHELHLKTSVSDRAYETALLVYRLAGPGARRWLQTRESFEMNLRNVLDGDVFTYRCGDVTPGGYHQIASAGGARGGQFGVNELERDYVEKELAARGFDIDYRWLTAEENTAAALPASSAF
jgi:2-iminoacetate synthase